MFSGAAVPKAVTLLGTNIFSSNYGTGIITDTHGGISTTTELQWECGTGANLGSGYGADFDNSLSTLPQNVFWRNKFILKLFHWFIYSEQGSITARSTAARDSVTGGGGPFPT